MRILHAVGGPGRSGARIAPLLAAAALLAAVAPGSASAQRTLNERHAAPAGGAVRIHLYAGSVRVTGWDRDSIAVAGTAYERGGDRFYIAAGASGSKLGLWPQRTDSLPPSRLEVQVPRGSSVWIKTVDAAITVEGVTGGLDLYSVAGRIAVAGEPRELYAESMSGGIAARVDTRVARLKTASGGIDLGGRIDDAATQTVSGGTLVHGGSIVQARFESVEGEVRYAGAVPRASRLEFVNHGGAVVLLLPGDAAADVSVNTFEGAITNGFKGPVVRTGSGFKGRDYTITLNAGGAQIAIRTFKGAITLTPR